MGCSARTERSFEAGPKNQKYLSVLRCAAPTGTQIGGYDNGLDARQSIEIAHCKCHSRALPHLQSPVPGKGGKNYSRPSLKRTFLLSVKRTFQLSLYRQCLGYSGRRCASAQGPRPD